MKLKTEIIKLRKMLLSHYLRKGTIPIINFRENSGKRIFYCSAGRDRLAITPDGRIWGCFLFPDYFKGKEDTPEYSKFFFGTLDNFIENHTDIYPFIYSNYAQLSMDNFYTDNNNCFLCPEIENCFVCPINASFSGSPLKNIPNYICEIKKIQIKEKGKFRNDLQKILK
ncbi:MAG: hypothetical protein ACETWK_13975 [Candidatus Aminicenantaceae bacterium]